VIEWCKIPLLREYEDEGGDLYEIINDFNDQIYITRGEIKDFLLFVLSYNPSKNEAEKKFINDTKRRIRKRCCEWKGRNGKE